MRRRTLIRVAITIFALAGLGVTESALARGNARCDTHVASPGLLLRDVPNAVRDLLPLPLYGVPQLFVSKPHFTKNGSELYSGVAVWKGSDEELVARGTERKTGQHGTFIIDRRRSSRPPIRSYYPSNPRLLEFSSQNEERRNCHPNEGVGEPTSKKPRERK